MRQRLLIATTVPETLAYILSKQPQHLNQHFDVSLVTSHGPELNAIHDEGVPVFVLGMTRGISPLRDLVSTWRMVRLLCRVRPDMVHSYTPKAGLVCMVAAWVCRVPVRVHTFTGLVWPTAQGWRQKLLMAVDRLLCACATHIVPEGLGVQRDLEAGRITTKQLRIIGHGNIAGVDVGYFCPLTPGLAQAAGNLRQQYDLQGNDFVYVFVGRLNRDKGLLELLEAFQKLPEHCRLLLVGALDRSAPVSEQLLHTLEHHPRVRWLGFQHDIRPALLAADVLVLPSYREGFPNVILQAGAMARPAVATDISGCNEIITPGLNGWLVPPRDAMALAQAMRQALETPVEALHTMGQAARARIVKRFERQAHWGRMVAFYHSLSNATMPKRTGPKLLLIAGLAESILNFRGDLLRSCQAAGAEVHVAAPVLDPCMQQEMASLGWRVHDIPLQRTGTNLVSDFLTVWALYRLMRKVRPEYVLTYTIKPVVYGSVAAWLARVPFRFAMITGLGYTFMGNAERRILAGLVQRMYRFALCRVRKVFFQNPDDETLFRQLNLLEPYSLSRVINGSGVNLTQFSMTPLPQESTTFLLIGRLLGDKGVREFVLAAQQVKALHPTARFTLVGWIDENPDAIEQAELDAWLKQGTLHYLGRIKDVRPALAACSVYVLPSYREGTPRTVLEAMAMGRPIITTDAPGCRETVFDGENGFLVPVKSVDALVVAMERFIKEPDLAARMGKRSREIAEDKYDVHKVNAVMIREMGL